MKKIEKILKSTCFLLLMQILIISSEEVKLNKIDLLNLFSHWSGYGTSILFPKTLKLLARKLNTQRGMMSVARPLVGGVNWELEYKFNLDCQKDALNCTVGTFLSFNNPNMAVSDYEKIEKNGLFGFPQALDGLLLVYNNNTLKVGMYKNPHLEESIIEKSSKVCKLFLNNNTAGIKIKYTAGSILGIYTVNHSDEDQLCVQFSDFNKYTAFYLSLTGSDENGMCSAEINTLNFYTHEPIQIISQDDKKMGDPFYAYFDKSKISRRANKFEKLEKFFQKKTETSKLLATELLKFADMSQADYLEKIKNDLQLQESSLFKSLDIIEREARAMQLFSQIITDNKKTAKKDLNSVFDEMLDYLGMVDTSYDQVDKSTLNVFNLIKQLKLPANLEQITLKTENLVQKLQNVLAKNHQILNSSLNVREKSLEKVHKFLKKLYAVNRIKKNNKNKNKFNKSAIKKLAAKKLITFKNIGIGILGGIGFSILLGFLVMFLKIRKAIKHKQIL